jgi:hypothetical protein
LKARKSPAHINVGHTKKKCKRVRSINAFTLFMLSSTAGLL